MLFATQYPLTQSQTFYIIPNQNTTYMHIQNTIKMSTIFAVTFVELKQIFMAIWQVWVKGRDW